MPVEVVLTLVSLSRRALRRLKRVGFMVKLYGKLFTGKRSETV